MYTIAHDGDMFYDPRLDAYPLKAPKLLREANKIGTLTFTIFPPHPAYGTIRTLRSLFSVYKDGVLIYQGRPAYSKRTFKNGMEYKCEEVTACMNDFMFRPVTYSGDVYGLFLQVISSFNNRSSSVAFEPGTIQNPGEVEYGEKNGYKGHWDVLQGFVKDFGGYIIPRYEGTKIYLDWLTDDDLPSSSQKIRFGENMTDMFIETDAVETFSGVIPLGGVPEGGTSKIDITSVNAGQDVIYNEDAVALYGPRETVKEWDITDPQTLLDTAYAWIRGNSVKFRQSVQLKAVDLHNVDLSIESFDYMHWVQAESTRHDLSERYILSREEVPLDKPVGTNYTLGSTRRTFSEK